MEDACDRTTAAVTSCWGRFGVAVLWRRLRRMTWPRRRYRRYVLGAGGLNYDPLSYSQNFDQNFDDGKVCECEPGFLARYALARLAGAGGGTIESLSRLCFQAELGELWSMTYGIGMQPSRPAQVSGMKSHGGKGQPKSLTAAFLAFARTSGGGEDAR